MKRFSKFFVAVLAFVFMFGLVGSVNAATTTVELNSATNFAILAGSGITNTGATIITGDVGSSPTPTETGFGTVTFTSGTNHITAAPNDATTQGAKVDLTASYNDAAGRTLATPIVGGDLGSKTLTAGVYTDNNDPDSLALTGTLTLDAQGDTNAVFIFQSGSTLTTAAGSKVVLVNGAQSCNVFWQVTSSATLGTTTDFKGTIMALTSITLNTGATINGRLLARNGAVTLDSNTITATACTTSLADATVAAAAYNATVAAATAAATAATEKAAADAAEKAAADAVAAASTTKLPGTGISASQNTLLWSAILLNWIFTFSIIIYLAREKRQY